MNHIGARLMAAASILVATSALAIASKSVALQLKLPKNPVEPAPVMTGPMIQGPMSFSVVDGRAMEDSALIGIALESGAEVYHWRSSKPVIPAITGLITQLASGWDISVAPEAELGFRFEIVRYFVTETSETFGSTYIAEVRLKASFVDKGGRVLWAGEASGDVKRPGVDGRATAVNEALSMALCSAVASALSSAKPESDSAASPADAGKTVIEPDTLFADLTRLKSGGVADDVLVTYVEQRRLTRPLTVDEILKWKSAGLPDSAIRAASK